MTIAFACHNKSNQISRVSLKSPDKTFVSSDASSWNPTFTLKHCASVNTWRSRITCNWQFERARERERAVARSCPKRERRSERTSEESRNRQGRKTEKERHGEWFIYINRRRCKILLEREGRPGDAGVLTYGHIHVRSYPCIPFRERARIYISVGVWRWESEMGV